MCVSAALPSSPGVSGVSLNGVFYLMLTNPTHHHFEENTFIF
jgi:hypothetical protein